MFWSRKLALTLAFSRYCEDLYRNGVEYTIVKDVQVIWDFVTEPVTLEWPKALSDPLVYQYIIPEIPYPDPNGYSQPPRPSDHLDSIEGD